MSLFLWCMSRWLKREYGSASQGNAAHQSVQVSKVQSRFAGGIHTLTFLLPNPRVCTSTMLCFVPLYLLLPNLSSNGLSFNSIHRYLYKRSLIHCFCMFILFCYYESYNAYSFGIQLRITKNINNFYLNKKS